MDPRPQPAARAAATITLPLAEGNALVIAASLPWSEMCGPSVRCRAVEENNRQVDASPRLGTCPTAMNRWNGSGATLRHIAQRVAPWVLLAAAVAALAIHAA